MYTFSVDGLKEKGTESHIVGRVKALDNDAEVSLDLLNNVVTVYTSRSSEDIQKVLNDAGLRIIGNSHERGPIN